MIKANFRFLKAGDSPSFLVLEDCLSKAKCLLAQHYTVLMEG